MNDIHNLPDVHHTSSSTFLSAAHAKSQWPNHDRQKISSSKKEIMYVSKQVRISENDIKYRKMSLSAVKITQELSPRIQKILF